MASSSASSSSSSSSASSSPPPPSSKPQLKRKRSKPSPEADSDSDSDDRSQADDDEAEVNEDEDEELVLSHAAKRKQKKQLKIDPSSAAPPSPSSPFKPTSTTTPAKKQKTTDKEKDKPSGPPKRQNSVWVGNLSFKTTEEALKRFFEGAGEVTRVHMPVKAVGPQKGKFGMKENRGFAYVDFTTEEAKKNAILMSEGHLDGRKLLIKDGDDFTGRPAAPAATSTTENDNSSHSKVAQKILAVQTQPPAPTLFFGNLGFETTQESLRGFLEAHRKAKPEAEAGTKTGTGTGADGTAEAVEGGGEKEKEKKDAWIRKVRMGTFEDSGLCKGWAFVDFTSIEHATAALTNPRNHHMDGRKLKVEYASADAVRRGGGPGPRPERSKYHRESGRDDARGDRDQRRGPRTSVADAGGDAVMEDGTGDVDVGSGGGVGGTAEDSPFKRKEERVRLDRKGKPRTKPGAALAAAQREQAAIVPSLGKKITFD